MKLYLFRHGETVESSQGVGYSADRIEIAQILPDTIPMIQRLAKYLKNITTDANYVSPYLRCQQTAEIISEESGKSFQINEGIGEFRSVGKNIESFDQFAHRINLFLDHLESQKLNSVAICTHGAVVAGIKNWKTRGVFPLEKLTDYPKTGIITIINENNEVEEISFREDVLSS